MREPVWRDRKLLHQIKLTFVGQEIAVGCNCTPYPFETRSRWDDPAEPMRIWREHMALREA